MRFLPNSLVKSQPVRDHTDGGLGGEAVLLILSLAGKRRFTRMA